MGEDLFRPGSILTRFLVDMQEPELFGHEEARGERVYPDPRMG